MLVKSRHSGAININPLLKHPTLASRLKVHKTVVKNKVTFQNLYVQVYCRLPGSSRTQSVRIPVGTYQSSKPLPLEELENIPVYPAPSDLFLSCMLVRNPNKFNPTSLLASLDSTKVAYVTEQYADDFYAAIDILSQIYEDYLNACAEANNWPNPDEISVQRSTAMLPMYQHAIQLNLYQAISIVLSSCNQKTINTLFDYIVAIAYERNINLTKIHKVLNSSFTLSNENFHDLCDLVEDLKNAVEPRYRNKVLEAFPRIFQRIFTLIGNWQERTAEEDKRTQYKQVVDQLEATQNFKPHRAVLMSIAKFALSSPIELPKHNPEVKDEFATALQFQQARQGYASFQASKLKYKSVQSVEELTENIEQGRLDESTIQQTKQILEHEDDEIS